MNSLISVKGLAKRFGENQVFNDVNFDVAEGTVTVLIGPSGSGKTTILRSLNALTVPESGTVSIGDFVIDYSKEPAKGQIAQLRSHSGMVFQGNNLFGNLTALENITIGPIKGHTVSKSKAAAHAKELLKLVGLEGKEGAYPHELSGGQQQRVGIARALALKPDVLLFDEPTSALDPELVGEVLSTIRGLAKQGWTMIIVTHEMRFARQVADQVIFIDHGKVIEKGTAAEILENPKNKRTKEFLRRIIGEFEI